ncbi:NADH-ubiquinone oxidoreductase-F iron-sulfur binding region domain-containing protein [Nocardia sp. NPDC052254]|uniref:NADH-ubiquinone oxidoreductase-F iron-sulfur binding region domain-containing protein n=1 Tax=Nocardia sp. NPDC052254 TaxID=3155681 RepID=UPI0034290853
MSALARLLRAAGLTGRGGADFPTGTKLELAQRHNAELIVNACDGELDARKDGWVIAHHLSEVLEGAGLLTARRIRFAAHRGSGTWETLRAAGVDTLAVPHRYVSSEESALTRLAHGGPARPVMRFEPITAGGRVGGSARRLAPTLVLNAETVWRVQQIVEHGPRWFRSFGTADEPGPRLVTLVDGVAVPGVYSAEAGLMLREILDCGGGLTGSARAIWLSGLSGGFVAADDLSRIRWSRAGLGPYGIGPGAGTVHILAEAADPWPRVLRALIYAVGESAGQCGPCMFGLPAVLGDLTTVLRAGPTAQSTGTLTRRLGLVTGRGACRYPDGVAGFVGSALRTFLPPVEEDPCHR